MAREIQHGFPAIDLEQESARAFLQACVRERVPPLLFVGPEGVGKEVTAIDFARGLCCERDETCELDGELCRSCHSALRLEHPGINLIYPTPTQGSGEKENDDEPDIGKILEEKRQDVFDTHAFAKKTSIRVARARTIIKRANSKPFNSPYNIFILLNAHDMREEAQNALLKLVEEPPDHCVIIWVTHSPDSILYTLRSRCQRVRFAPLKTDVIEKLLVGHYEIKPALAKKAAGLAQGRLDRARTIAAENDDEGRESIFGIIERLPDAPESWLIGSASAVSRGASRDAVARFLDEFAVACRDMMAEDPTLFVNQDRAKQLEKQTSKWKRNRLPAVIDRIIQARNEVLVRNLNIEAALADLFLDIKHIGC